MGRPKPKRNRRRIGARAYKNYSEDMLRLAVEMVRNKNVTSYDAEKQFGIPRRTIEKRVNNLHTDKPGPRYRFSEEEELQFVKVLIVASEFGCPLTQLDFRLIVLDYLKKNNKADVFNGNPPGDWWVKNFLVRHQDKLTVRSTQNIKKARAEKTLEDFQTYFENLKNSVEGLPASHILNYDETNVSDDPGAAKGIFRRGVKYPERIVNHSKGCISIMFSGTASGDLLAPYVVYKSENMWTQWCNGGPEGTRYNRTKSGWFDSAMFMDWFTTIIIPWAKSLEGPKVIIGDNLSSHINIDVIELCERHNIRFVLLPPNSTQLTQPLDVAFFAPLKRTWRKILMKYKIENPKQTSLNKMHFPLLLKQLIEDASLNKKDNLISGFRATGISPYNPRKVYSKIPEYYEENTHDVDKSLLDYLKENRNPNPIKRNTNKKMCVPAGKSVTSSDINKDKAVAPSDAPEKKKSKITIISDIKIFPPKKDNIEHTKITKIDEVKAGPSGCTKKRENISKKRETKKIVLAKRPYANDSDSDSICSVKYADSSDVENEDLQDYLLRQLIEDQEREKEDLMVQIKKLETKETEKQLKETQEKENLHLLENSTKEKIEQQIEEIEIRKETNGSDIEETQNELSKKTRNVKTLSIGQYILVKFESTKNTNKYYCGLITNITEHVGILAKFMRYKNGGFYWPTVPDTSIVFESDIIEILPNPCNNRRGILYFDVKFQYKLE